VASKEKFIANADFTKLNVYTWRKHENSTHIGYSHPES